MDDDQLRRTADTRPGYATYPDTRPGSPCWWARHGDQPPTRRPAVAPECSTSHPQLHADCDGCTCPCHSVDVEQIKARFRAARDRRPVLLDFGPAYGDKAGPSTSAEIIRPPRRRWWHRYTRRSR